MPTKLETEIAAGRFSPASEYPCTYASDECSGPMKWVERINDAKWHGCLPICTFHKKFEKQLYDEINAEDLQGEDE